MNSYVEMCGAVSVAGLLFVKCFSLRRPKYSEEHWTNSRDSLVIGHRGCRVADTPTGNTMSSFRGINKTSAGLELDVQMTADGHLVVFHDLETGNHLQGKNCHIAKMDLADIRNRRFVAEADRDEVVPTLSEVMTFAKENDLKMVIEIKGWNRHWGTARAVTDMVEQRGLQHSTMIISFNPVYLYAVRTVSDLPMSLISTDDFFTDLCGLSEVPILNKALFLADRLYEAATLRHYLLPTFIGSTGISAFYPALSTELVTAAKESGFSTNAWTVNEQSIANDLRRMGVTLVTTDLRCLSFA